jgi:TrmH family RNA methyltransferase
MPEIVKSRNHPLFKRLADQKRRGRDRDGLLLIEGVKLLEEAASAGLAIREVAVSEPFWRRGGSDRLAGLTGRNAPIRVLDERLMQSLSELETSQGVLALAEPPSFDERAILRGVPLIVVAVAVQNPGNLGGLLRTAEAAGTTGAWLTDGCADPLSWKSLRGSMGSAFRLPHRPDVLAASLLDELRRSGVRSIATCPDAKTRYDEADLTRPSALLFGSEGSGLSRELAEGADERVRIPMSGRVESLNVGVAAGVLLFEAARQRRARARG